MEDVGVEKVALICLFQVYEEAALNLLEMAIRQSIRKIPSGRVATYGQVAEAAGYPGHHRQVAQILSKFGDALPWHRVCGAGGQIKTRGLEQRMRLEMEGVSFRGSRIDMRSCQSPLHAGNKTTRGVVKVTKV